MSDGTRSSGTLVTVGRFLHPTQAQMAKGMLESFGVPCFLQGEHANHMVPLAFRARLQVLAEDEATARELLRSVGDEPPTDGMADGEDPDEL